MLGEENPFLLRFCVRIKIESNQVGLECATQGIISPILLALKLSEILSAHDNAGDNRKISNI